MNAIPVRRALLSVSDKSGLPELASALAARDIAVLSSGGTATALREAGVPVTGVSEHTGAPEIFGGRVKTLHPRIHGGILARRGTDDAEMEAQQIDPIDLVVVNLYPFTQTIARSDATLADAIENIDIGGPAMLRAAAKNHAAVAVIVDPADYTRLIQELDEHGGTTAAFRRELAIKAFAHTAAYDDAIVNHLSSLDENDKPGELPRVLNRQWHRHTELRYGENPHQEGCFYADAVPPAGSIGGARLLQGKALSYNNLADADAAWQAVLEFEAPACVIVKHANPCGIATADDIGEAYERAYATDSTSAFGGIIAFNRPLDAQTASTILDRQFVEVMVAPEISEAAREVLAAKPNLRALETGTPDVDAERWDLRTISGGLLVQQTDLIRLDPASVEVVTRAAPDAAQLEDMLFAWSVVKMVKSNAIVFAGQGRTLGIGAGQMSRVDSVKIAVRKAAEAGLDLKGSVMASDAFFPFPDALLAGAEAGASAVIQPGGSKNDDAVIEAANEAGLCMVLTGRRHFRH